MNIPENLNIQPVINAFIAETGLDSSKFDLGFMCRYCEETESAPNLNIPDLVIKDVEALYKDYNSTTQQAFESLCTYYTSLINAKNRAYYYAVQADSINFNYIKFDGKSLGNHLKTLKLRRSPAKNYIILDKGYFNKKYLLNTMNILVLYTKSKLDYNVEILGVDLQTNLVSPQGLTSLIKEICTIVDDISMFETDISEPKVREFFEKLNSDTGATHFWITKKFSDRVLKLKTIDGEKNFYILAYLALKMNLKFYFEDSRVGDDYPSKIHSIYSHRYDTFEKKLAFIEDLNSKKIVLKHDGDEYTPLGVGVVQTPKQSFNVRAIDISDVIDPSPIEAKLTFIKMQNIAFTEEDVIPMDLFLEYLPEVYKATFENIESGNIANKILDIFTEMQRLAIYLIKEEPVRKADLVIVQKGENYFLTVVNSNSLRLSVSSKHITGVTEEGIKSLRYTRSIPLNCIMPVKAYDFFGEETVSNVDEEEIESINRHAIIAYAEAKSDYNNARTKYRKVVIASGGKEFYYYLIVLNTLDTKPESKELYKSMKEYDSNLLKLLQFDDAGNIIDTKISGLM